MPAPTLDATVASLVALVQQQAETINVLVKLVAEEKEQPPSVAEIIEEAKDKIIDWLGDHPDRRPSKSELARLLKIPTSTAWAAYVELEAAEMVSVQHTKSAHRLSLRNHGSQPRKPR
ncbi:hypothetical protein [Streptomyces sp. SP17KL33]|uniref:hypothetical protein n=1 Tax=Streptomyces sp. SP17KL33 TaxID=3002534 RepID=UPI002E779C04|nr:hypothetical protein [Streptomyces sp. SP17KL33]MEE1834911.1 hypothetical protein [Streptomyces sp. SP17KL33]